MQGQHTESIVTQQSVLRYTWGRAAAGAAGGPTRTDRAGNNLKAVEYESITFIGTNLTAAAGFENAITFHSVLFLTSSHVTSITLKAAAFPFTGDPATGN